jgi:hypothetical protein
MCGIVSIRDEYTVASGWQQRALRVVTFGDAGAIRLQRGRAIVDVSQPMGCMGAGESFMRVALLVAGMAMGVAGVASLLLRAQSAANADSGAEFHVTAAVPAVYHPSPGWLHGGASAHRAMTELAPAPSVEWWIAPP